MVDHREIGDPSPWWPEPDSATLAVLGKCAEEFGEATSAAARAVIQGVAGCEPRTGKPNLEWIEDEFADVLAVVQLARARLGLRAGRIADRQAAKHDHLSRWLAKIDRGERSE